MALVTVVNNTSTNHLDVFFYVLYFCKASSFVSNFAIWIADTFIYIMNCPNIYIYYCIFNMKV